MEADEKDGAIEGMKLSMFDISDPSDVKETAKEDLTEYGYAEALYDYKKVLADQTICCILMRTENLYSG